MTQYIAVPFDCISRGVSPKDPLINLVKVHPEADIYTERKKRDTPGTIKIRGPVICMLTRFYPSYCGDAFPNDSPDLREGWFGKCVNKIVDEVPELHYITFVNCGEHRELIYQFIIDHPHIVVSVTKV